MTKDILNIFKYILILYIKIIYRNKLFWSYYFNIIYSYTGIYLLSSFVYKRMSIISDENMQRNRIVIYPYNKNLLNYLFQLNNFCLVLHKHETHGQNQSSSLSLSICVPVHVKGMLKMTEQILD